MRKLNAIWLLLTHKAYFLAVCKTGKNGDDMTTIGHYTYAMAETLIKLKSIIESRLRLL